MLKKAALLTVSVALLACLGGCGAGQTPAEIAESYGILNKHGLSKDIAGVIQSGQADYMIASGHADVRTRINGSGDDRVMVTEYMIQGEPYRIEVRRPVDPIKNIWASEVMNGYARKGSDEAELHGLRLSDVVSTLKKDSYEAEPAVAYRAWKDCNGTVHPVRVMKGKTPDWQPTDATLDIVLRTRGDWPGVDCWIRGMTTEGRRRDPDYDAAKESPSGNPETSEPQAVNGQWIVESPGPGVQGQRTEVGGLTHFVNIELYDAVLGLEGWE